MRAITRFGAVSLLTVMASTAIEPSQASDPVTGAGKDTLVFIGTHTSEKGQGIYLFRLQSAGSEVFQNVTLVPLGLAVETPSPTHFELDRPHRRLFTVNQIDRFEGKPTGAVSAYAINAAGSLTLLNQRSSLGIRPCDLVIDKDGRHLIVANCANGSIAVFPVADDGMLAEASQMIDVAQRDAAGATDRAPCVALDPANRFVFVCDPSSARIRSYMFDTERGTLTPTGQIATALTPGPTPRQMRFRHDARFAYLLNEQSTVTVFAYDATTGSLTEVQTVSTLPEYFDGANVSGELYIHRSGKWLYASNIGHNSIALFTIDAERGTLTFVEEQGTGGKTPRQFGMEPSSKHLAISNRDSNTVLASRIDEGNGRLKPSGIFADVPSPAAIRFLPPPEAGQ